MTNTPPNRLLTMKDIWIDGAFALEQGFIFLSMILAAASILAKVDRDALMDEYHHRYPAYGFARHKGYGSEKHRNAVALHGPCVCHRRSFAGVKEHCEAHD